MCFHHYCNLDCNENDKIYRYIINYVSKISQKRRKGLKKISFKKGKVLDFYYHLNGITHLTPYFIMVIWYRYKKAIRIEQFKIYEKDLI